MISVNCEPLRPLYLNEKKLIDKLLWMRKRVLNHFKMENKAGGDFVSQVNGE